MKTEFPTIKELMNAILYTTDCDRSTCTYNQETCTFHYVELIPIPCYDDGGSIDSMDFYGIENSISFLQAYRWYENLKNKEKEEQKPIPSPIPSPVPCFSKTAMAEDIELPF